MSDPGSATTIVVDEIKTIEVVEVEVKVAAENKFEEGVGEGKDSGVGADCGVPLPPPPLDNAGDETGVVEEDIFQNISPV